MVFSLCYQLEEGYCLQFVENFSVCFPVLDGAITHIFTCQLHLSM